MGACAARPRCSETAHHRNLSADTAMQEQRAARRGEAHGGGKPGAEQISRTERSHLKMTNSEQLLRDRHCCACSCFGKD
ncbi:hypothetical protein GN956_G6865 [Arapaima gigas]